MRKNIIMAVAFLSAILFAGCSQDEGNYDYHSLNEPNITGVPESISVLTHSDFDYNPDMGDNITDLDAYTYEWKAINKSGDNEVTVLSTEKHLNKEVEIPAGEYSLYFTATEKKSGLFWRQCYSLTVSDVTSEGWLVLCDVAGKTRLDMVSDVTHKTIYDVLKSNGMPELNKPYRIQYASKGGYNDSPFYLFTADGATRLSKNSFAWQKDYAFKYEVAKQTDLHPQSIVYDKGAMMKLCVSDGYAYYASNSSIGGLYAAANKAPVLAPYVGCNVAASSYATIFLLYDDVNKCFMSCCLFLPALSLSDYPYLSMKEIEDIAINYKGKEMVTGTAFTEYPTGLDFVYMENTKYDPGNAKMGVTYTVLKSGKQYYLYGIQLGDMLTFADCPIAIGKAYYGDLSDCTDIDKASCFAFSSLKNFMYYSVGGTVYRVNLSETPLKAQRQFTLRNEKITVLKFNLYQNAPSPHDYDLVVGSDNRGDGALRIYEGSESEGDFSKVNPTIYTGFAKIVDAIYRERTN